MYQKELEIAKLAANEASKIIREYANSENFGVKLKGKNDLVTDADVASEKAIISCIKKTYPTDQFLAEESNTYTELPTGRVWIIDPIDGTTNFAHGFPIYCVSIALWVDGVPKVGLVLEVANGILFTAIEGGGAFQNGKPISISNNNNPSSALIGTGFPYNNLHLVDNYLRLFKELMSKTHGVRRPGSAAYDLCLVASGTYEGFYEYGLSPWDVAAGVLIIKEAGGIIIDWKGEQNWLFGKRIIAGNNTLCAFLKNEIHTCFEESELTT